MILDRAPPTRSTRNSGILLHSPFARPRLIPVPPLLLRITYNNASSLARHDHGRRCDAVRRRRPRRPSPPLVPPARSPTLRKLSFPFIGRSFIANSPPPRHGALARRSAVGGKGGLFFARRPSLARPLPGPRPPSRTIPMRLAYVRSPRAERLSGAALARDSLWRCRSSAPRRGGRS